MPAINLMYFMGTLTIGMLMLSGWLIALDALTHIRTVLGWLAASPLWELFTFIPFLLVAYLVGLVTIEISSMFFNGVRQQTTFTLTRRVLFVAHPNNSFLASHYEKLLYKLELLQGACPAVLFLGLGLILQFITSQSEDFGELLTYGRWILLITAVTLMLFCPILLLLASQIHEEMEELTTQLHASARPTPPSAEN
jgi:Na+-transporting methylmalonyl-CoA/oxaloacetate decarboxylase beta subunit